jgi:hypothetical protein
VCDGAERGVMKGAEKIGQVRGAVRRYSGGCGTKIRCSIAALGRETDPRWVLFDSDSVQYIGPPVESSKSPEAVERLVSPAWWGGQATRGRRLGRR